jgi:hypothetical protein
VLVRTAKKDFTWSRRREDKTKNEMEKEMEEKMTVDKKNEDIVRSRVLVEMLLIPGTVNIFPAIYRTWRFVTVYTSDRHLPRLQAPHPPTHLPEYPL